MKTVHSSHTLRHVIHTDSNPRGVTVSLSSVKPANDIGQVAMPLGINESATARGEQQINRDRIYD